MAILFPWKIWKHMWTHSLRIYFTQFCVISTPTLMNSIPPLLHKNQTKLSPPKRVPQNVYFSFCLHSCLLAPRLLIFKAVIKEPRQFNNRLRLIWEKRPFCPYVALWKTSLRENYWTTSVSLPFDQNDARRRIKVGIGRMETKRNRFYICLWNGRTVCL